MAVGLMGEGEATLADGRRIHLVLDNEAWMTVEDVLDQNYLDIARRVFRAAQRKQLAPVRTMRAVVYGATRMHHADLSIEDCQKLIEDPEPAFSTALTKAFWGSMAQAEEAGEDAAPGEAKAPEGAAAPAGEAASEAA